MSNNCTHKTVDEINISITQQRLIISITLVFSFFIAIIIIFHSYYYLDCLPLTSFEVFWYFAKLFLRIQIHVPFYHQLFLSWIITSHFMTTLPANIFIQFQKIYHAIYIHLETAMTEAKLFIQNCECADFRRNFKRLTIHICWWLIFASQMDVENGT